MTSAEKLEVARSLARMGVDIIEAGFPAASPDDLEAVRRIAQEVGRPSEADPEAKVPVIAGLARANKADIDKAWEAIQGAAKPRIHTFLATSAIHMKHKLKMDPEEVVQRVSEMVAYARSLCADVGFSPEDAGRSDPEFLYVVLGEAIKSGATTLNIPDTVGYTTPDEYFALIDNQKNLCLLAKNSVRPKGVVFVPEHHVAALAAELPVPIYFCAGQTILDELLNHCLGDTSLLARAFAQVFAPNCENILPDRCIGSVTVSIIRHSHSFAFDECHNMKRNAHHSNGFNQISIWGWYGLGNIDTVFR